MTEAHNLRRALDEVLQSLEDIDEEIIRSSMDTIRQCNDQLAKYEGMRVEREAYRQTFWYRLNSILGGGDSWMDSLSETLTEVVMGVRVMAQESLKEAVRRKRERIERPGGR